ncbi:MAG: 23S rRNA (adenine(2503)-C(2))-methyltransferase RlmN [Phycisphaerales bacterium]|nr:23S rRNA (adenine(2503)-C(2))-methyltransferase RlmN [Phycisphaerales bacterium]
MPDAIDILGLDSRATIGAATAWGIAPAAAQAAYRSVFRSGSSPAEWLTVRRHAVGERQVEGSTVKFTLRHRDGLETESVLIPMPHADGSVTHTLCVSSQVGCAMGCGFCETAQMGLMKNLDAADIVAQWHAATHTFDCRPKNLVFMGMGEPMDNLDAVMQSIRVLADHNGAAMPPANIAVSTVGRPEGIARLGDLARESGYRRLNLAVSINAPNDEIRASIMPINRAHPMAELMEAMLAWPKRRSAAICVEYVLIPGVNDAPAHCDEVCAYLRPLRCALNVIPYNPRRDSPWPAPSEEQVQLFVDRAATRGQFVKRRQTKGRSVMAACGQLGNAAIRRRRWLDAPPAPLTLDGRELLP